MAGKSTVLITGASGGIGSAAARLFAMEGFAAAIHYYSNESRAEHLAAELTAAGCDVMTVQADVADAGSVDAMFAACEERFGGIDILVNNAGTALQKLFCDTTDEEFDHLFGVNVKGIFHCCRAAAPGMIRRQHGKIINISSVWGVSGASCEVCYSASKAAVIGLTKALAKELAPSNINVNCVAPGVIDTPMNASLDAAAVASLVEATPAGRLGTPEDIAALIYFLAGEQASFINGQTICADGAFL